MRRSVAPKHAVSLAAKHMRVEDLGSRTNMSDPSPPTIVKVDHGSPLCLTESEKMNKPFKLSWDEKAAPIPTRFPNKWLRSMCALGIGTWVIF